MGKNIELEQLVINKLTQAQYDALAVKNPGELYFITDANPTKEVETQLAELSEKVPEPISTYESFPEATAENVGMRVVYTGETIEAPYIENEDGSVSTVFLDPYLTRGHTFMLVPVELSLDTESITIYMWQDVNGAIPPIGDDTYGKMLSNNGITYEWMDVPETGLTKEEADQTYLPLSGGTLTGPMEISLTAPYNAYNVSFLKLKNVGPSTEKTLEIGYNGSAINIGYADINQAGTIKPGRSDDTLGDVYSRWGTVYATKINWGISNGVVGGDLIVPTEGGTLARLEDIPESTQVETIPEASVDNIGKVLQYIGETNETYTNGYFYKSQGDTTATEESVVMSESSGAPITMYDPSKILLSAWETHTGNKESFSAYYMPSGEINLGPYPCNGEMLYTVSAEEVAAAGITVNGYDVSTLTSELAFNAVYTPASTTIENLRWEQVSVQPASETLPDQTDNAGKFLMTDGTDASWSDKPLVNLSTSTNNDGVIIYGTVTDVPGIVSIGKQAESSNEYDVAIGYNASASGQNEGGVSIGYDAYSHMAVAIGGSSWATGHGVAIGLGSQTGWADRGIVIGYNAKVDGSTTCAIQLGGGSNGFTNSDSNTFKVANENGNFEMMDANGKVPLDRLTYVTDQIGDISTVLDSINGETLEG